MASLYNLHNTLIRLGCNPMGKKSIVKKSFRIWCDTLIN